MTAASSDRGGLTFLRVIEDVAEVGFTQVDLGKAVGASARTVHNWASGHTVPSGVKARRLLDIQYIVKELRHAYTDEGVRIWLNARNRNLERKRPIDLLAAGEFDTVMKEAERLSGAM